MGVRAFQRRSHVTSSTTSLLLDERFLSTVQFADYVNKISTSHSLDPYKMQYNFNVEKFSGATGKENSVV
jgi:hypothetical protein